jgi:hypothetical protein
METTMTVLDAIREEDRIAEANDRRQAEQTYPQLVRIAAMPQNDSTAADRSRLREERKQTLERVGKTESDLERDRDAYLEALAASGAMVDPTVLADAEREADKAKSHLDKTEQAAKRAKEMHTQAQRKCVDIARKRAAALGRVRDVWRSHGPLLESLGLANPVPPEVRQEIRGESHPLEGWDPARQGKVVAAGTAERSTAINELPPRPMFSINGLGGI